ncbi:MAG: O-antigen ligase family protein [Chloroflexota bacterium]
MLLLLVTLPRLIKRPLPRTFLPLLAFVAVAMISSTIAFYSDLGTLRGVSMESRFIRNAATLALGLAFYFTVTLLPNSWEDLLFSVRWLYAGFAVALLWGSLQAIYVIHFSPTYFKWLNQIQSLFSGRKLFSTRISGMTYEPKWFAEQLCLVLLPWLISSVLTGRSIFKWRFKWVTLEMLLLAWCSCVLVFTYSRTGLSILALLVIISFILYRSNLLRRHPSNTQLTPAKTPSTRSKSRLIAEVGLLVVGILTVLVLVGSQNPYFSRFWRYWTEAKRRNRTYFEFIAFQQRFVYLETAFKMYEAYPLLGVGLGNYAFHFADILPSQLYRQPEIIRQITPVEGRDSLVTPKNLFARLLAETGIAGTLAFLTFLIAIAGCITGLWLSPTPETRFWGLGGFFSLLVFFIIAFSFDSFAVPNMWIVFGMVTAAAHIDDAKTTL